VAWLSAMPFGAVVAYADAVLDAELLLLRTEGRPMPTPSSPSRRLTIQVDVAERLAELEGKIDRLSAKLDEILAQKASVADLLTLQGRVERLEEQRDSDRAVALYKAKVWKIAAAIGLITASAFGGLIALLR
jgi:TolA-binding protein